MEMPRTSRMKNKFFCVCKITRITDDEDGISQAHLPSYSQSFARQNLILSSTTTKNFLRDKFPLVN